MKHAKGFAIIEVVVVVVVIAILAVGAYLFFNKPVEQASEHDVTPTTYQSDSDLDKAAGSLDATDIDASFDDELELLDKEAASF